MQAASDFKTGAVDAIIDATGVGAAWIGDIMGDGSDFKLISLSDDEIAKISEARKEFSVATIPAGSYRGQPEEVRTVGNWVVVVVHQTWMTTWSTTDEGDPRTGVLKERHNYFKDLAPENIEGAITRPCIRARRGTTGGRGPEVDRRDCVRSSRKRAAARRPAVARPGRGGIRGCRRPRTRGGKRMSSATAPEGADYDRKIFSTHAKAHAGDTVVATVDLMAWTVPAH